MKKFRYSTGMKAIAIMLQELFAVLLVISVILIATMFDRSMLDIRDFGNKEFAECGYYEHLFQSAVAEVLLYIDYQEQFETDGVFNPEKIVSIAKNDKFRYYLKDLESWSKDYVFLESKLDSRLYVAADGTLHQQQQLIIDDEKIRETDTVITALKEMDGSLQELIVSDAEYYYGIFYGRLLSGDLVIGGDSTIDEDETAGEQSSKKFLESIRQKVKDGRIYSLDAEELIAILKDLELLDKIVTTENIVLEEKYLTVDETTILKEFLSEEITLNEMVQAYENLEKTVSTIGEEVTAYKRMVNKYEKGNSNLQFWVSSKRQNMYYTNITEPLGREELLNYGKRLGSYFYYNDNTITLNTNVDGMEDAFYEELEARNNGKNTIVFVAVNQEFPHEDGFFAARVEYNQLRPWIAVSLVGAVVSIVGCFLSFSYLSLAAGRTWEDTKIHLIWFDKIPTEILILSTGGVCVGIVYVFQKLIHWFYDSDIISMSIMAGGLTLMTLAIFMTFYMSFVRRMKAGVMWSGSLCHRIGRGIHMVIKNWRPSVKILLMFGGHVVLTLIMIAFAVIFFGRREHKMLVIELVLYLLLCGLEALLFLREGMQRNKIISGIKQIAGGDLEYEIDTTGLTGDNKTMGEAVNAINEGLYHAVDDSVKNERLKTDLITNVSHDIKTPLTSIINYVDLLKREELTNERAKSYIRVLDAKSQRLKQLTEDLVEASKVSSGNIVLHMEQLNFVELVHQTAGEFEEKFQAKGLIEITSLPKEPVMIMADGRRIWRVLENLYNNVAKYAMKNTRVYVDMDVKEDIVSFSIKNISEQALNIQASELTERFIRGDVSRSSEGSGLGLSIAKNLTNLMGGTFDIYLDGDLFKVTVTFLVAKEE